MGAKKKEKKFKTSSFPLRWGPEIREGGFSRGKSMSGESQIVKICFGGNKRKRRPKLIRVGKENLQRWRQRGAARRRDPAACGMGGKRVL